MSVRALRTVAALALALACAGEESGPYQLAPAEPRAALILEPPQLALGSVAEVELAVVTRPDWSVRPQPRTRQLTGLAWIGSEPTEVVREPARWIHRTRLRVRALEVGRFELPGGSVEVVSPEGEVGTLVYEPLLLEVRSGLSDLPGRGTPFGVRLLPRPTGSRAALAGAFAAGAGLTLACVGLLWLVRRRLREPFEAPAPTPVAAQWERAREELALARAELDRDPRAALDASARALRSYVVMRFGGDARVRTTPELEVAKPPFALTTRWSGLVALLADLDAARFPPLPSPSDARARASQLLDAAEAFVESTTPAESR
jgi:hypothetical protein